MSLIRLLMLAIYKSVLINKNYSNHFDLSLACLIDGFIFNGLIHSFWIYMKTCHLSFLEHIFNVVVLHLTPIRPLFLELLLVAENVC